MALGAAIASGGCSMPGGLDPESVFRDIGCPTEPPPEVFSKTLCVCEDLDAVGEVYAGRSVDPAQPALAVNGRADLIDRVRVDGSFVARRGLDAIGDVEVGERFATAGNADIVGDFRASQADIGGDLDGAGSVDIAGTLRLGGVNDFVGDTRIGRQAAYASPVEPPCGCSAGARFDVAAAVASARTDNDNAAHRVPTRLDQIGDAELRLGSGRYYFTGIDSIGDLLIVADGKVAIYVDGDIDSVGRDRIAITPGSTLDLHVAGNVSSVGDLELGNEHAAFAFRLYVGGTDVAIDSIGDAAFNASIYAPDAELHTIGDTYILGAALVRRIDAVGGLAVGYTAPDNADLCSALR